MQISNHLTTGTIKSTKWDTISNHLALATGTTKSPKCDAGSNHLETRMAKSTKGESFHNCKIQSPRTRN